jgi:hypothetical protein
MHKMLSLAAALLWTASAQAAFFMDTNALMHLLPDYEAYQDKREIRYMAKASQFIGYVTGIVDGTDGAKFCLPGAVNAERASDLVAGYLRNPSSALPRKAADTVADALASRYPCTH